MQLNLNMDLSPFVDAMELIALQMNFLNLTVNRESLIPILRDNIDLDSYAFKGATLWAFLSQNFPFTEEELNTYSHKINYKNLKANPYLKYMNISQDTLDALELLNELNN